MKFLLSIHPAISFTLVATVCSMLAIIGILVVRKNFHEQHLKENHEVGGFIFNAFGLLYSVFIAFVVFTTWGFYDSTKRNIEMEANKLADMYMDAGAFSDPLKMDIRIALAEYTKSIVEQDWPVMASGEKSSQETIDAYKKIWEVYVNVDVKTIKNPHMYDESLHQLNAMSEYRRLRKFSSKASTPTAIWFVLISGGSISVAYTFFFGTKRVLAQCIMTSVYTTMNSMVLFLIYVLEHPFTGYAAISDEPFRSILRIFIKILGQ